MEKILGVEVTPGNVAIAAVSLPAIYFAYRSIRATKAGLDAVGSFVERRERDNNVFHAAANGVTEVVTLDKDQTLGGAIYDVLYDVDPDRPDATIGPIERFRRWLYGDAYGAIFEPQPRDGLQTIDVDAINARRL